MTSINRRSAFQGIVAATFAFGYPNWAAAAPVNEKISGTVPALKQPSTMSCWATVATMMYSWKKNQSVTIQKALGDIGSPYLTMFNSNSGLSAADKPGFLAAAGLKSEAPQNYTTTGWANLLKANGPLWITTNEGTLNNFSIHARVLTAIFGDGTLNGTTVVVVDPADGQVHTEKLGIFVKKFEDVARIDLGQTGDLRPQVVHY